MVNIYHERQSESQHPSGWVYMYQVFDEKGIITKTERLKSETEQEAIEEAQKLFPSEQVNKI